MRVHKWGHLAGHTNELTALRFSPADPTLLASASSQEPVYLWNISEGAVLRKLVDHPMGVVGLAFSSDGWLIALALANGTVWICTQEGDFVDQISGHRPARVSIAFSPTSHRLAVIDELGQIYLWDLLPVRLLSTFSSVPPSVCRSEGIPPGYYFLAFSPDGRYLAVDTPSTQGSIQLWQILESWTGAQWIRSFNHGVGTAYDLTFTPQGHLLAIAGDQGVLLLDAISLASPRRLTIAEEVAYKIGFSPDGRLLAVGSGTGTIYIGDIANEKIIAAFKAHSETISWAINGVAWSPNGKILATGGWEIQTAYRTKSSSSKKGDKHSISFPIKLWEIEEDR